MMLFYLKSVFYEFLQRQSLRGGWEQFLDVFRDEVVLDVYGRAGH